MLKSMFIAAAFAFVGTAPACDSGDADPAPSGDLEVSATFAAPVATGQNTLTVTVTEDDGTPVTGATVTVDRQMPSHGHGSSETSVVTELGDGIYEATPVTFQMPGPWVVHVKAVHGTREGLLDLEVTVP